MPILHRLTLVAVLCASMPVLAIAEEPPAPSWDGFARFRELYPLTTGYLILEPTSGFTLAPGTWGFEISVTASNTFAAQQDIERALDAREQREPFTREMFDFFAANDDENQTFYLDSQVNRTALRATRGVVEGLEVGVMVPLVRMNGGFTDGVVEDFHDLLGLEQEGRKGVPKDRYALYISGRQTELDLENSSGLELGDIVLTAKKRLTGDGESRSLAVQGDLKLPTGDSDLLISSGGTDFGLSFIGSWCWTKQCLHGVAGYVFLGSADLLATDSQALFSGGLGYEQVLPARWALSIQMLYWQSYLDDLNFEHFAEDTLQAGLTVSKQTGWGEFVLGISENTFSFKNSADVSFQLAWRRRLD